MQRGLVIWSAVAVIALSLLGFVYLGFRTPAPLKTGDSATKLQATTLSGSTVRFTKLKGKTSVLDFFAAWCQPCQQEMPTLVKFAQTSPPNVRLVMIDRGDSVQYVRRFIAQYHLPKNVLVLMDPSNHLSQAFGVTGQPETIVINQHGIIAEHVLGPQTDSRLVQMTQVS